MNARTTSPRACLLIFFALTLALAAAASLILGVPQVASGQTALVTTSVSEIAISEGHSAEYQLKLGSQPPGNVIVMQAVLSKSQDRDDVVVSPMLLYFNPSNWDTYQTVAVSAYQDDDSIDDSAVIGHEALNSSYQSYGEVTEVSVTVSDDDPAPAPTPTPTATPTPEPSLPPAGLIIVTPPDSALDDIEGIRVPKGGQASFTVRLATQPTDDVPLDITLVYNRHGSLTSSPSSMMFTTADWDTPQTVTVRSAAWGNNSNAVLRLNTGYTEDDAYYFLRWIDYRVREYDAPGIVLSPSQVAVGEGSTTTYGVRLNTKPTADVTVAVAEGTGDSDITVTSSKTLNFTAYNWKRSQYVTLSAAHDDDLVNGSRAIMHTASSSGDYAGIAATLTANEADDETAALLLSTNAVTVPEGGSASYTVRLSAQPASAVSVSIAADTSQDGDFVPAPASLSFNASNWNSAQTVSIAAREDDDGVNGSADIRHTASGAEFNGLTATVLASESDNDTPGITFSPPLGPIFIPEGGSYLYTVVLDTAPTAEVSITVSISGDDDINIPGTSKTWSFTAADWNTPQQVRIRADEDGDTDNGTATVSHTITTADSDYAEMSIGDITATERDNDLSVTLSTNALTVPEGSTASYTVKLSVQPTDDVTVVISEGTGGGNDADITVSSPASKTLTFTTSSYDTAQTVTLRAAPDPDSADGSRTITHTANGGGYSNVSAALTATENDDTPLLTASSATATTVTLTIDNYSGQWRYKHTGQGATCSAAQTGTTANVTGLSVNTQYTFKAYNDDCAVAMVTASAFTTANPSLTSSNITNDSATLTLSAWTLGKDGNWHYKHTGQGATCSAAQAGTTASLSGLDSGTQYTYTAYGDSNCDNAVSAAHTFTTSAYALTAGTPTATTVTLTIANWSGNWHYKYTSPTGGTCSAAQTGTTANLTGLTKNTTYTFKAYSDSSCSSELVAASAFTTTNPTLASSSVTHNSATLTLSGWAAGTGTGKDGNWHLNQVGHGTSSCTGPFSAASTNLTGLDAGAQYEYQAYSDNACSDAISAAHSFTTPATPTLTAGTPTATTVTLTIGNYSSDWHYKYTSPTGGTCSAAQTGTTANLTGLTKNTAYTFKAYSDSSCSSELAAASAFTTTNPALASSDVTHDSATLTLSGWAAGTGTGKDGNWYFKADKAPHNSCSTAQSGASVSLSGFNAGTQYTYTAYSDSGCATAISAAHSLTTTASTLTAGTPTATTVTLTVTNHTGNWHYKYTSPTGGTCSAAVTGTAANLTGLTRNTTYTFKAYSDSGCATEIATASAFTTTNPTLAASSVTHSSATLTLSGWTVGTGTGKDGNWYYKEEAGSSLNPIPCSSMQTGTSVNITSGLQSGERYAFHAFSDSGCATTITPELSFVTPALTAGTPTATTNTLTISDYTGNWYHKHAGQGATCSSAIAGTTANVTGLTKNTSYTYTAYSDSGCSSVVAIAAAFTTATPALASSNATHNSATLTVSGWAAGTGSGKDGNWHYKYTSPTGGTCSAAQSGQSASVTNLLGSTTYTFKAYSDSSCASEIATAANFTTLAPVLTASGITGTAATLKLQGGSAAWYYKRIAGTPADTTCNSVVAGTTTASLSGLTANTLYGYTAYSDSACATEIDTHHFATTAYDVGNLDVAAYDECYAGVISGNARRCAVAFTTGSRTDGYALQSVTAKFKDKQGSPGSIVVAIHAADSNNNSNPASTATATLTGSDPDTAGLYTYACSGGSECTLAATTTYFVVMSTADTAGTAQGYKWETTTSNDEANHPSTGVWAISNQGRHKRGSNAWSDLSFSRTGMLHIAANDAPVSISASGITTSAATLTIDGRTSAWHYKRTGGPSDTTCNTVAAGTSTASLSSLNAGTSYTYTAYSASDCGSGALDATTFSTLMPVDNLDKTAHQDPCKVSGNSRCALAFTTGGAAGGYTLESLTAKFNAKVDNVAPYQDPGSIIVTLHADNSGVPADTALATLSGSDPDTAGDYTYACSGSGCALSPSTTYFAQFTAASGRAADEYYAWVTTASDDQNLSPTGNGWSLANNTDYYYFHNWGAEHDRAGLLKITAAVKPGLAASSIAETSATLTLSHYSGAWWYKGSQSGATCKSVAAGTSTASLSSLSSNSGNDYTYTAYNASGCDSADEIASVSFSTPTFTAGTPSGTSVTLTIANHTGNWHYKHTSPFSGACSSAQTGTSATFSTLLGGATYIFKAYSDSACSTALATAASFTTSGISVNNLGETLYGSPPWYLPDGSGLVTKLANSFETGSNSAGYTLNNVLVKFGDTTGSPGSLTVSIYSHSSNSGGEPNTSVITLSGSNPTTAGDYKYTCSSSCDLSKDTTYWLVLGATNANTNTNKYTPKWTGSKSQTTAPSSASAWSIGDEHKIYYSTFWYAGSSASAAYLMFGITATAK